MINSLLSLLKSDRSTLEIVKDSGVSYQKIDDIRNNNSPLGKLTLAESYALLYYPKSPIPVRIFRGHKGKFKAYYDLVYEDVAKGEYNVLGSFGSNTGLSVEDALAVMGIESVDDYFSIDCGWKDFDYNYLKVIPSDPSLFFESKAKYELFIMNKKLHGLFVTEALWLDFVSRCRELIKYSTLASEDDDYFNWPELYIDLNEKLSTCDFNIGDVVTVDIRKEHTKSGNPEAVNVGVLVELPIPYNTKQEKDSKLIIDSDYPINSKGSYKLSSSTQILIDELIISRNELIDNLELGVKSSQTLELFANPTIKGCEKYKLPPDILKKKDLLYDLSLDEFTGLLNMLNTSLISLKNYGYSQKNNHPLSLDCLGLSLIMRLIIEESAQLRYMFYKDKKSLYFEKSNMKDLDDCIDIVKLKSTKQSKLKNKEHSPKIWYKEDHDTIWNLIESNLPVGYYGLYTELCNNCHASRMRYEYEDAKNILDMYKKFIYPLTVDFLKIYNHYFLDNYFNIEYKTFSQPKHIINNKKNKKKKTHFKQVD